MGTAHGKLFVVASLPNKRYKIVDPKNGQYRIYASNQLIAIESSKAHKGLIANITVRDGELVGLNGSLTRYAQLTETEEYQKKARDDYGPLIIVNRVGDSKFTVLNYLGQVTVMSESALIEYEKRYGIANGKVTSKGGKEFISAISGEYEVIEDTESKKEICQQVQPVKQAVEQAQPQVTTQPKKIPMQNDSKLAKQPILVIKPEQMDVLREYYNWANLDDAVSNVEIQYINEALKSKSKVSDMSIFNSFLARIGNVLSFRKVFGDDIALHMIRFIMFNIPMPESLVKKSVSAAYTNINAFYVCAFPEFSDSLVYMLETRHKDAFRMGARLYLEQMLKRECLGRFRGFDSQQDSRIKKEIESTTLCREFSFNEMRALIGILDILYKMGSKLSEYFNSIVFVDKGLYYEIAHRFALKNSNSNQIAIFSDLFSLFPEYYDKELISRVIPSIYVLSSNPISEEPIFEDYKDIVYHSVPFSQITKSDGALFKGYHRALDMFNNLDAILRQFGTFIFSEIKAIKSLKAELKAERRYEQKVVKDEPKDETEVHGTMDQDMEGIKTVVKDRNYEGLLNFDRLAVYTALKGMLKTTLFGRQFEIADDLVSRGKSYESLSNKQVYRVDQAIKDMYTNITGIEVGLLEDSKRGTKKRRRGNSGSTEGNDKESQNIIYNLVDMPDVSSKIDCIISKQGSVEMNTVLSIYGTILGICNTVLSRNKVSTRQLNKINAAYDLLMQQ